MSDNILLASKSQRYEIIAGNGQVLEHGFTSQKKALAAVKEFKLRYPGDRFSIRGYDKGKYGNE